MPNFSRQGWAYVVELKDGVKETSDYRKLTENDPLVDPEQPAMYVNYSYKWPRHKFPKNNFSDAGNSIIKNFGQVLREDLQGNSRSRQRPLLEDVEKRVYTLRGQGHAVFTSPQLFPRGEQPKSHNVYVILLPEEAKKDQGVQRQIREARREPDEEMPCVYVGETARSPEKRLERHLAGEKSNKFVHRYKGNLAPALYQHLNPLPPLQALRQERDLSRRLERLGYWVLSG